jgi:O-antigen ligase
VNGVAGVPNLKSGGYNSVGEIPNMPPIIAGCAVLSALLPIHPSMQAVWIAAGVPSIVGVLLFLGPAVLYFLWRPVLSTSELDVFSPFVIYLAWMLVTSLWSPAIGMPNWWSSVRSLVLILPAMLLAAGIAARNPRGASFAIIGCGILAGLHYSYLWGTGQAISEEGGGFGAIAVIEGVANYQATVFYIGILGVWAISLIELRKRYLLTGGILFLLSVALMSTAGARSSMVGLIVVVAFVVGARKFRQMALVGLLGLVVMVVGIFSMHLVADQSMGDELNSLPLLGRFLILFEDSDSSHRIRLFRSALEMWLYSPVSLVFGGGLAAYPVLTGQADEAGWYPHNFILESLAEGGVLAALPLGVIIHRLFGALKLSFPLEFSRLFIRNFALFSCASYMFMGGIESVWIPFFGLGLYLFATKLFTRIPS